MDHMKNKNSMLESIAQDAHNNIAHANRLML